MLPDSEEPEPVVGDAGEGAYAELAGGLAVGLPVGEPESPGGGSSAAEEGAVGSGGLELAVLVAATELAPVTAESLPLDGDVGGAANRLEKGCGGEAASTSFMANS